MTRDRRRVAASPHALKIRTDVWMDPGWRRLGPVQQVTYIMLCCQPRPGVEPMLPLAVDDWAGMVGTSVFDMLGALCGLTEAGVVALEDSGLRFLWLDHFVVPSALTAIERERRKMTPAMREIVFERDGRICRVCAATENLHIDHVVPIARGGLTELDNLAVLCGPCNLSKSTRPWDEWLAGRI